MLGDPLHLLVLMTNGSAGWWGLKYILAKLVFAFSISLCVLTATKHVPAAAIMAASVPFIGFFSYRYAHPAFFSLCYAPLILLCWLKFTEAPRGRATAFSLGSMAVANWMVLNSGTVKEAYVLLLTMNFLRVPHPTARFSGHWPQRREAAASDFRSGNLCADCQPDLADFFSGAQEVVDRLRWRRCLAIAAKSTYRTL